MKDISNISLIPVIELEPQSYANNREYIGPDNSNDKFIDEWDKYNKTCYRDAGLKSIIPIEKGSWLFELGKLSEGDLKIIFSTLFKETVEHDEHESINEILSDPIEYAPLISGGYILKINDKIVNKPGCCCGLETIIDWEAAANGEDGEIYTGHDKSDLLNCKTESEFFYLNVGGDEDYKMIKSDFNQSVSKAKAILVDEMQRIAKVFNQILKINNGNEIIHAMLYKN